MPTDASVQDDLMNSKTAIGGTSKRFFDVIFSIFALIVLSPLLLVIIVIHKSVGKGPLFFAHERVGLNGNTFMCLKFRTMVMDADERLEKLLKNDPDARAEFERDHKLKDDPRIIPFVGKMMRSTSIDELPQFWNVIRGEMSVVGPRPVTEPEFVSYGDAQLDYISSRPGVTGLWQVSGRNHTTFQERLEIDRTYVKNWSFFRDILIVFKTVSVVLKREGAY